MKVSTDPIALTLGASPVIVVAYHSVIDWATTTGFDGVSAVVGPFIFGVGLLSLRVVRNQRAEKKLRIQPFAMAWLAAAESRSETPALVEIESP